MKNGGIWVAFAWKGNRDNRSTDANARVQAGLFITQIAASIYPPGTNTRVWGPAHDSLTTAGACAADHKAIAGAPNTDRTCELFLGRGSLYPLSHRGDGGILR